MEALTFFFTADLILTGESWVPLPQDVLCASWYSMVGLERKLGAQALEGVGVNECRVPLREMSSEDT